MRGNGGSGDVDNVANGRLREDGPEEALGDRPSTSRCNWGRYRSRGEELGPQMPEPLLLEHEAEKLSASLPTSINTAGLDILSHNLFARNLSTDGSSSPSIAVSREGYYQTGRPMSMSDVARHSPSLPGPGPRVGSGVGPPSGHQGHRGATTYLRPTRLGTSSCPSQAATRQVPHRGRASCASQMDTTPCRRPRRTRQRTCRRTRRSRRSRCRALFPT